MPGGRSAAENSVAEFLHSRGIQVPNRRDELGDLPHFPFDTYVTTAEQHLFRRLRTNGFTVGIDKIIVGERRWRIGHPYLSNFQVLVVLKKMEMGFVHIEIDIPGSRKPQSEFLKQDFPPETSMFTYMAYLKEIYQLIMDEAQRILQEE